MARLLLIDDDALLRDVLATALVRAGHTVFQAGDGHQGAALFRVAPPDLIITDLVMPGCEGIETIATLHRERPGLPIIAMSGNFPRSPLYLALAAKLGARRTLAKPFNHAVLLRAVDELLAGSELPAAP
jgi:DNA-binding response OmpR family regulator